MSTLEKLYYGNVNPCERFIKKESEYHKLTMQLLDKEENLLKTVSSAEKALYEQIIEIKGEQENFSEKEMFIDGFRLGAQIMLEILTQPESQFDKV